MITVVLVPSHDFFRKTLFYSPLAQLEGNTFVSQLTIGYVPDTAGRVQKQGIAKPVKALLKETFLHGTN